MSASKCATLRSSSPLCCAGDRLLLELTGDGEASSRLSSHSSCRILDWKYQMLKFLKPFFLHIQSYLIFIMKTLQVLMEGMLNLQQSRLQLGKFLGAVLDLGAEGQEALQNLIITSYFLTIFKILLKT